MGLSFEGKWKINVVNGLSPAAIDPLFSELFDLHSYDGGEMTSKLKWYVAPLRVMEAKVGLYWWRFEDTNRTDRMVRLSLYYSGPLSSGGGVVFFVGGALENYYSSTEDIYRYWRFVATLGVEM